ncbi:Smr/MutS family protein [Halobacteriovorax sp.]|uniref:endonuclease MutS2 n=1 Tax=Halobacteriovorax sp. TaxID=2020862 RepID=UPI0035664534
MALNLLDNSSSFLEYLDWNEILDKICSFSYFEHTKGIIPELLNYKPNHIINRDLSFLDKFIDDEEVYNTSTIDIFNSIPRSDELERLLSSIEKNIILNLSELNTICKLLENYPSLERTFESFNIEHNYPDQSIKSKIRNKFINKFRVLVSKDGQESLENHPQLSPLYKELREIEQGLRRNISTSAKKDLYSKVLQYSEHDIINDRYVLAIRSDSYNSKLGVIIAKSSTGMTLFVEPYELRERSNQRIQIMAQIDAIINEICKNFCNTILEFERAPLNALHFFYKIDLIRAKANFSNELGLSRPTLNDTKEVYIKDFFHPLIDNCVLNTIKLNDTSKGLIISGPNTGGKTVTLKSITLCYLMSSMGLYVPARECNIFLPEGIYYFSHDQQDLSSGLSSFASEAKNYLELLSEISENSLIVVDEIFNSTSSEEASALAISFLEQIHSRSDARVIISTHHQFFKTYIHSSKEYISSHVGFDIDTSKPTYKLNFGSPGSSMAFKIFDILASKFGLSNTISSKAEHILDKKQLSYEQLLQELSQKKAELDKKLLENRQININLKNQKKSMDGLVLLEKERITAEYKKKLDKIISQAESLLVETKKGKIDSKKQFNKKVVSLTGSIPDPKKQKFNDHLNRTVTEVKLSIENIKVGEYVYSPTFNRNLKVIAVNIRKKEIQILNGKMTLWMSIKNLSPSTQNKVPQQSVQVNFTKSVSGKLEIDGRGMRLDDFQRLTDDSIHELINGDIPFLNIIHGHGEGILKKWLRNHLRTFKELDWQSEDGNDGATRLTLKN